MLNLLYNGKMLYNHLVAMVTRECFRLCYVFLALYMVHILQVLSSKGKHALN